MAGLGNPPADAETPQAEQGETDQGASNVTPEEQAQYEQFVKAGLAIIYPEQPDGQVSPEVMANLKGDFDQQALKLFSAAEPPLTNSPQDSASATAVLVTILVENSIGQDVPDEIVMHGGKALLEEMAEIDEAAKIHDFTDKELEGAWYRAIDLYRVASPRADPESLRQGFNLVLAADKAGKLDDVLSGKLGGADSAAGGTVAPGLPGGPALPQGQTAPAPAPVQPQAPA